MADNDDLLTSEEIEALMKAARSGTPPGAAPLTPADLSDPQAIDALIQEAARRAATAQAEQRSASRGDAFGTGGGGPAQLLQQAEDQLAAALATDLGRPKGPRPELGPPQEYLYSEFGGPAADAASPAFPIAALQDVELDLRIELGRTELLIEEVLQLREGTVVPLDKLAGDPVDILVNGRLIARGEVLVLNDNFCVRVAEILTPEV